MSGVLLWTIMALTVGLVHAAPAAASAAYKAPQGNRKLRQSQGLPDLLQGLFDDLSTKPAKVVPKVQVIPQPSPRAASPKPAAAPRAPSKPPPRSSPGTAKPTVKPSPKPSPKPSVTTAGLGDALRMPSVPPPAAAPPQPKVLLWKDPSADMADRVDDLLASLTVDEKVTQFGSYQEPIPRLGIPGFQFWTECLHGHQEKFPDRGIPTMFPQPLVLAATFDPDLARDVYAAISDELRAKHNAELASTGQAKFLTCWTPHMNIFRDPRWGRGSETYGEDPHLTTLFTLAAVNGLQGDDSNYTKIVATCKHFLGYSLETSDGDSRFNFNAQLSPQDMVDTYTPAFKACVQQASGQGIMCSYNAVNGTPACANPDMLTGLLRQQWGFKGYVVSDCNAVSALTWAHGTAKSKQQAAAAAIRAGTDLLCDDANKDVAGAVKAGLLKPSDLDTALRRTYLMRFKTGQFDPPGSNPWSKLARSTVLQQPKHITLARTVAQKGTVLLKNSGLLPLVRERTRKLCVVGPFSNSVEHMMGNYYGAFKKDALTIFQAIRAELGSAGQVTQAPGMDVMGEHHFAWPLETALQACSGASAAVVVVGSPAIDNGDMPNGYIRPTNEGEGQDRSDLHLPGRQLQLLKALTKRAPSLPLVVVLVHGGPLDVSWMTQQDQVAAILSAGYGGQEGGRAISDILFGRVSPSGRLPVTWYHNNYTVDVPMSDMRMRPDPDAWYPGRSYRFLTDTSYVQFPFGYGLSYTTFAYEQLRVAAAGEGTCKPASKDTPAYCVSVTVTNTGSVAGEEVVLLYLSHTVAAGTRGYPLRSLRGVKRTRLLRPDARQVVTFELDPSDFEMPRQDGSLPLHVGAWKLTVGDVSTTISVTAD